jgi:putative virion core protein (lumpy skin disease virus)
MKCQKCGELVLGDSKFCDVCGQRLVSEKECSCGYICEQQFQFCPRCGKNFETGKTLYEIDIEKEKKIKFSAGVNAMQEFLMKNGIN